MPPKGFLLKAKMSCKAGMLAEEAHSLCAAKLGSRILDPGKKAQSSGAPGQLAERLRKLAGRLGGLLQGGSPLLGSPSSHTFPLKSP